MYYLGVLNRSQINCLFNKSVVGLILLKPTRNYFTSLPIKMFEYMAAGIPFVCSDFPAWRSVIEETHAGICVDLANIKAVKKAIISVLDNRELAQKMGDEGRKAVEKKYNWSTQFVRLDALYEGLKR